MITFAASKKALDEIAERLHANNNRLAQAKAIVQEAVTDFQGMSAMYGPIVGEITTAAGANLTDVAWQNAAAEANLLVAEFGTANQRAITMNNAIAEL